MKAEPESQPEAEADGPPIAVGIGLIARSGRYLVRQRPDGTAMAGYWEFPGGKCEPGEPPEAAVVRECREETGLDVRVRRWPAAGLPLPSRFRPPLLLRLRYPGRRKSRSHQPASAGWPPSRSPVSAFPRPMTSSSTSSPGRPGGARKPVHRKLGRPTPFKPFSRRTGRGNVPLVFREWSGACSWTARCRSCSRSPRWPSISTCSRSGKRDGVRV